MDYASLIAALTPAVDAAGSIILDIKAKGPASMTKSDGSPVTIADQKAENILLAALADICPDIPVVSEENTDSHHLSAGQRFFLVDPLDGTKEFIRADDNGAFTVNIGLIENGLPVMGMIYAPPATPFIGGIKAAVHVAARPHASPPSPCAICQIAVRWPWPVPRI